MPLDIERMTAEAQAIRDKRSAALAEPTRPGYSQLQQMGSGFRLRGGAEDRMREDLSGVSDVSKAMSARALAAPGTSPWEKMMLQRQGLEQSRALDEAKQRSATEAASTTGALAMRGGVGAGGRERAERAASRGLNLASAGVSQSGALQRADIGTSAEEQRLQAAPQAVQAGLGLGGAYSQAGQVDLRSSQQNIQNAMEQQRRKNVFGLDKYKAEMEKWAAERQAQAEENSGKK